MSAKGHIPLRRCVACRRVRPQTELLRMALIGGVWQLDEARRAGGRGSWVCPDTPACRTPKRLGRSFRAQTDAVCTLLSDHHEKHPDNDPDASNSTPDTRRYELTRPAQTGGMNV